MERGAGKEGARKPDWEAQPAGARQAARDTKHVDVGKKGGGAEGGAEGQRRGEAGDAREKVPGAARARRLFENLTIKFLLHDRNMPGPIVSAAFPQAIMQTQVRQDMDTDICAGARCEYPRQVGHLYCRHWCMATDLLSAHLEPTSARPSRLATPLQLHLGGAGLLVTPPQPPYTRPTRQQIKHHIPCVRGVLLCAGEWSKTPSSNRAGRCQPRRLVWAFSTESPRSAAMGGELSISSKLKRRAVHR